MITFVTPKSDCVLDINLPHTKNGHYTITEKEPYRPVYPGAVTSVEPFTLPSTSDTGTFLPGVFLSYDSDLQFREQLKHTHMPTHSYN